MKTLNHDRWLGRSHNNQETTGERIATFEHETRLVPGHHGQKGKAACLYADELKDVMNQDLRELRRPFCVTKLL